MELAMVALGSLLHKLGTLLTDAYKLHKGVRGEIKFLQAEMESMQAVLYMLSRLPTNQITDLDKIWVRNLKELSYDIEDSVDTFMVRIDAQVGAKPHSFKRFFDRTIGLLTKAKIRHRLANDIEDIKRRIHEVVDRRQRYKLEGVATQPDVAIVDPRVLASFEHAAKLVGTDVPVRRISNLLTCDKQKMKRMVVSIVGVGGLGKTTIANLVYERLREQFDCKSFVSVSLWPNMTQILSKILRQVGGINTAGEADSDELIRNIRFFLKKRSMFPEDFKITRQDLIRLWVGEGFIVGEQRSNLYDVGERYFKELVNRSMIKPIDVDVMSGTARSCRVHDMILDLIISLSAQDDFVTISGGQHDISSAGKIRRLSLQGSEVDMVEEDNRKKKVILPTTATAHVRTIIQFGNAFQWMPPLSGFPVLRVLDLRYVPNNKSYLKGLGRLQHLRYLKIMSHYVQYIEEITKLKHLKTLDLIDTEVEELPASIVQLTKLECLIVGAEVKFPNGVGNMVSLQQLSVLNVSKSPHSLLELGMLTRLRELHIVEFNDSCVKTFLRSLTNLHYIRTLHIETVDEVYSYSLDCIPNQWSAPARLQYFKGAMSKVPRWFSSLCELSCLHIYVANLRQDDLQLLGTLPMLHSLHIHVYPNGSSDERLVIGTDQLFHSLTYFKLEYSYKTCWLVFAEGVMPKLERLDLLVPALSRGGSVFDAGLENLTSLKQVEVRVECKGAKITKVRDAEIKLMDTILKLPNHPTLTDGFVPIPIHFIPFLLTP